MNSELIYLISRENCLGLSRSQDSNILMFENKPYRSLKSSWSQYNVLLFTNQTCDIKLQILLSSMGEDEDKFIREQKNVFYELLVDVEKADEDMKKYLKQILPPDII